MSITTPAMVGLTRTSGRYSFTGPNDATTMYIATMHPEVGKVLSAMLREAAAWQALGEHEETQTVRSAPHVTALADLLLAGEQ